MSYGFVGPRSTENARLLLELAQKRGFEVYEVRATIGGYYVPDQVARDYEKTLGAKPEESEASEPEEGPSLPDDSWKNADIKEWATAHGVDLGDATKKADMLAAIRSADKEE